MKKTFNLEVQVDQECDNYGYWANYDLLVASGNDLDELMDDASISIMDQDGGEVDVVPADESWMQDLIEDAFRAAWFKYIAKEF